MTAGHSPFDFNSKHRQAHAYWSPAYQFVAGLAILLVVGFTLYAMVRYQRAKVVAGPLVQARPDGSLLVAWQTGGSPDSHLVLNFGNSPGEPLVGSRTVQPTVSDSRHVAHLPEAQMSYPLSSYSLRTRMFLFYHSEGPWTLAVPRADGPFRFTVFGENNGSAYAQSMAVGMLQAQPHLILHVGNLILETGQFPGDYDSLYARQVTDPYSILLNTMPFMPVIGSREAGIQDGRPFQRFFVLPANGPEGLPPERNYWFDYATARFVAIDTSAPPDLLQQKVVPWLQQVLTNAPPGWKFVFMQRSPHTAGQQNPPDEAIQQILVPAFEALGVDMVFSAGNHLYERTHPLRSGQVAPAGEGIVYITTGSGGRNLSPEKQPPPPFIAAFDDQSTSFTVVELLGGRVHIRQVAQYGQLLDDWGYTKPIPPGGG
jgi:hypothetical protein